VGGTKKRTAVRYFDTLVTIVASIVILGAVAFVGTYLAPATGLPSAGPPVDGAVCQHEPLIPSADGAIQGLTQLCVTEGGIQAWVELVGLRNHALYTGWIAHGDRPFSSRGFPCGESHENPEAPRHPLARIDGAIADRTGRARLVGSYQRMQLKGSHDVWILIVGHGVVLPDDRRTLVWEPGWGSAASVADRDASVIGQLIGCSHIGRRGGVETLE